MKRGTNHTWEIRKYAYDAALYAYCPCGFEYRCSQAATDEDGHWNPFIQEIHFLYRYCPNCGAKKKWMTETQAMERSTNEATIRRII